MQIVGTAPKKVWQTPAISENQDLRAWFFFHTFSPLVCSYLIIPKATSTKEVKVLERATVGFSLFSFCVQPTFILATLQRLTYHRGNWIISMNLTLQGYAIPDSPYNMSWTRLYRRCDQRSSSFPRH